VKLGTQILGLERYLSGERVKGLSLTRLSKAYSMKKSSEKNGETTAKSEMMGESEVGKGCDGTKIGQPRNQGLF
jgi:hypothetical protein